MRYLRVTQDNHMKGVVHALPSDPLAPPTSTALCAAVPRGKWYIAWHRRVDCALCLELARKAAVRSTES